MNRSRRVGCISASKGWVAASAARAAAPSRPSQAPGTGLRDARQEPRRRAAAAAAQHGLRVLAGGAAAPGGRKREQQRDVALALVDPDHVVGEGRRAGEPAPDGLERLALEELVEADRMSGGPGRESQQQARGQARPTVGGAGARGEQHEALTCRLAGEGEQQQRLRVALLREREPDAESRRDAAPLGVAQQRVGPAACREPALGEPRERHRVEAQAPHLERRDDRDAVTADPPQRDAIARQQLAEHGGRFAELDVLLQHRERVQAGRRVSRLVGGLGVEDGRRDVGEEAGPLAPRRALGRGGHRRP